MVTITNPAAAEAVAGGTGVVISDAAVVAAAAKLVAGGTSVEFGIDSFFGG